MKILLFKLFVIFGFLSSSNAFKGKPELRNDQHDLCVEIAREVKHICVDRVVHGQETGYRDVLNTVTCAFCVRDAGKYAKTKCTEDCINTHRAVEIAEREGKVDKQKIFDCINCIKVKIIEHKKDCTLHCTHDSLKNIVSKCAKL